MSTCYQSVIKQDCLRRVTSTEGTRWGKIVVDYGLRWIVGNDAPYFSITCEAWMTPPYTERNITTSGASHDLISSVIAHYDDLIRLHLSRMDGSPMHALANGWYWLSDYDGQGVHVKDARTPQQRAEDYLRAPAGYFDGVRTDRLKGGEYPKAFIDKVDGLRDRWRYEADNAIRKHGLQGAHFVA